MLSSSSEKREPVFNLPLIMILFVGALVGLYLWAEVSWYLWVEYDLDLWGRWSLIWDFSFTPARFHDFHTSRERYFSGFMRVIITYIYPRSWANIGWQWLRLVSYSFLHLHWLHLGLNLVWLVIFGSPLSYRLGAMRFILFWVIMAMLSALTHFAIDPTSHVPMIGASGVVSALMGAAVRYDFYRSPHARFSPHVRLLSMKQALMNKSSFSFIGIWLALNLAVGFGVNVPGLAGENIAWAAHIGGLIAGFVLIGLFDRKKRI